MSRLLSGGGRRLAAAAIAASWLGAAPVCLAEPEAAAEPAPARAAAVFAPRAPETLRGVDDGVRLWIVQQLRRGGVPVVDAGHTDEVAAQVLSASHPFLQGSDAPALARETEAGVVVLTQLRVMQGQAEVWIRAYDANGQPIAVGRGESRLAALGEALVAALVPVHGALAGGAPEDTLPPRLPELGRYERALDRMTRGELATAWSELAGVESATADALREDLVALSAAPGADVAQRSRLASTRGAADPDWLAIRHALQKERNAEVLLAGAEHAAAAGDAEGALVLYAEAAKASPGQLDAERGRARMLTVLERHVEAKQAFEHVLSLAPGDVEAQTSLAANPTLAPADQASWWLRAGEAQSRALDDEGARASFANAAALEADLTGATQLRTARLAEALGEDVEALGLYDEAAAREGSDLEALEGLGRMRARTGDLPGASAAFEQVLAREPDDPDALAGHGDALLAQGDFAAATPKLERALALAPRSAERRSSLARALQAAGKDEEALRVLDPSQVEVEAQPLILSQSAELHAAAGRLGEAQAALERAVTLEPDEPPLRTALASVHAKAGNTAEAERQQALGAALSGGTREIATTDRLAPGGGAKPAATTAGDEFAALAGSFPTVAPDRRPIRHVVWLGLEAPQTWQGRVRSWVLPKTLDVAALEAALRAAFAARFSLEPVGPIPEAAETSLANVRAFGTEAGDLALVNDVLGAEAVLVARVLPLEPEGLLSPPGRGVAIEVRLGSGRRSGDVALTGFEGKLADASPYLRWNPRAAASLAVALVLLLLPVVRGWGSIVVVLDYERTRGSQGFFTIELSRRPGRTKQEKKRTTGRGRAAKYQRRARAWSRFTRHMVGRETPMRWLPARHWYVAVHGLLQDTTTQEVIGNYLEERKIRVERGKQQEVAFDFRRKAAPIEVQLFREEGKKGAIAARVAVLGAPDSLRFAKEDRITMFVGPGKHTLLVAVEDRVYERPIEVRELVGHAVPVQIDHVEGAAFSGSAEAVDAYLQGDLLRTSELLERAGQREPALLVRAAHHRARGEMEAAARCLEQIGRFAEAAELTKQSPAAKRSADLFAKAGDFHQAAEEHTRAGDPLEAARAFEAGFEYAAAIEAYKAAGAPAKALDLLEKTGRFYEAGALALELGEADRGIRCLQQVGPREPEYAEACETLAGLFAERNAFDLAVEKAREALDVRGADDAPLEVQENLARLLERAGSEDQALAVWENIRKRDFQYPGASERIEALRQSVAAATQRASAAATARAAETAAITGAAPPAPPGESRYEPLGEVGRGGMGVVVKARDTRLGRIVALKRMPENLKTNPTAVQLFLREARAAAALSHPNIVTLFDAGQEADGSYYLTMELLEGFGLDTLLKKRGRLSARDAVRLGIQIAKGLQFAHEKGVVHRDIKTANLFFTKDRVVKIMDFGLAKMSEEVRRSATVIGGTPYYMAPEQAAGAQVDHRADLYAFGVTLFELVTGQVPFREGDVTHHHRHTPAPDPRTLAPDLPDALAALIARLMAKRPEERPATTAEVVRSLEQLLAQLGGPSLSGAPAAG